MPDDFKKIGDGKIGGKAKGLLDVRKALEEIKADASPPAFAGLIETPDTVFVTTKLYANFIEKNGLSKLVREAEAGKATDVEEIKKEFLKGDFVDADKKELLSLLGTMTDPLAVRSSSLLEDQKGSSFAGKYESVFVGNQGDLKTRSEEFLKAVKLVYASSINPSAIAYRVKHGFINEHEEMAVVVQRVVGRNYNGMYLPALAGVGFSQNGYCWSKNILKKDGLVRLVFGLGTRAVGRGYVRLFSPTKPDVRPEGTEPNNIQKCSQKKIDVVDLATNELKSVHFRELISDGFDCYPGAQSFVSLRDGSYIYRPVSNLWDASHIPILTLDGVLSAPWMGMELPKVLGWLLSELEKKLGHSVDVEFAVDVDPESKKAKLFVLQTRALSEGEGKRPHDIPNVPKEDVIFTVSKNLPTAYVPDIEYMVYVNEDVYHEWPANERQSVARVIGKLNEVLKGKKFILVGPGRWGSWNPQLGVPVNYSEISNCSMLVEVAKRRATYLPEVSFGSHFFQDLIEDNIAYLPLYPDESSEVFNEMILNNKSEFASLLADDYYRKFDSLISVIDIPNISGGRKACAILNGEVGKAIVFISRSPS